MFHENKLLMSILKTFDIIINKNLVHVQIHFLKIELVHAKFTQYERVPSFQSLIICAL